MTAAELIEETDRISRCEQHVQQLIPNGDRVYLFPVSIGYYEQRIKALHRS